ncbi:MAG TPA: MBL fold metallo-hydrolase [Burkholderiaceae bacterium]|jgi:ribonuclease BN (tRNA processing enzyme)|nr:MBL fold metallo-hydrolase [Burkholderiaceae bacterium]
MTFLLSCKRVTLAALSLLVLTAQADAQTPAANTSASEPSPLELVVLGSGGPGATGRAGSSYLILKDGVPRILVDAGPGSFARLGEAKLSLARTDIVLLTHLHIDHVGELPGLFKARAVSARGPINFHVFGPDGKRSKGDDATFPSTSRLIHLLFDKDGAFAYLKDFSAPITITASNLAIATKPAQKPKTILSEDGFSIQAIAGHHRDAPAEIYRVNYAGKSITFSGDIDAEGLPDLREIARGSDLLVFNSVVLDPPGSPEILYTLHTPPKAIGEVARDAGVKQLLLSHISPAVDNARTEIEASIANAYQGTLQFAQDGLRVLP